MKKSILILFLIIPILSYGQIKISQLTEATNLNSTDLFLLNQGAVSKKLQLSTLQYKLFNIVPYALRLNYSSDSLRIGFKGDSVKFETSQPFYAFSKPVYIQGHLVGSGTVTASQLHDSTQLVRNLANGKLGVNATAVNSSLLQGKDSTYIEANWGVIPTSGILSWNSSTKKYEPYAISTSNSFYFGSTLPTGTTTLNLNYHLKTKQLSSPTIFLTTLDDDTSPQLSISSLSDYNSAYNNLGLIKITRSNAMVNNDNFNGIIFNIDDAAIGTSGIITGDLLRYRSPSGGSFYQTRINPLSISSDIAYLFDTYNTLTTGYRARFGNKSYSNSNWTDILADGSLKIPVGAKYQTSSLADTASSVGTDIMPKDWILKHVGTGTGEPALGNPSTNGYVLSSTTGGTRSWIANGSGGGMTILADSTGSGVNHYPYLGTQNPTKTTRLNFNAALVPTSLEINYSSTGQGSTIRNTSIGVGSYITNSSTGMGLNINNSSSGYGSWIYNTSSGYGSYIYNSSTGMGSYITNSSNGMGLNINNSSSGKGSWISNSSSGYGSYIYNSSTGMGLNITNSSTGMGLNIDNTSTGKGLLIKNIIAKTPFAIINSANDSIAKIDKDGLYHQGVDTLATKAYARSQVGGGGGFTNSSDSSYISTSRIITTYTGTLSDSINGINLPAAGTYQISYNFAVTVGASTTCASTNITVTHNFKNTPLVYPNGGNNGYYTFAISALTYTQLYNFSGSFITTVSSATRLVEECIFTVAPSAGNIYTSNHYLSYIKLR